MGEGENRIIAAAEPKRIVKTIPIGIDLVFTSNNKVRYVLKYPVTVTGQDLMHASFGILTSMAEIMGLSAGALARDILKEAVLWDAEQAARKGGKL